MLRTSEGYKLSAPISKKITHTLYIDDLICVSHWVCYDCLGLLVAQVYSGEIHFDPSYVGFLGQSLPASSFCSELYAQAVARIYILQYLYPILNCKHTPVWIISDNLGLDDIDY